MKETQKEEDYFHSGTKEFLEKYGLREIHYTFYDKFRFVITAGLGLIAAIAWDEALREIFHAVYPNVSGVLASLVYAFFLTVFATAMALLLKSFSKDSKKR